MVPSRVELLILALLARCLNQLGQGTICEVINFMLIYRCILYCNQKVYDLFDVSYNFSDLRVTL